MRLDYTNWLWVYLFILIGIWSRSLSGQEIIIGDFSPDDPLSLETVQGMAEDTSGRIWILNFRKQFSSFANNPGEIRLTRINGYSVTNYLIGSESDLALRSGLIAHPNGTFLFKAYSFHQNKRLLIQFNPYSFEERVIDLGPACTHPNSLMSPSFLKEKMYLIAGCNDSLFLYSFDSLLNMEDRKVLQVEGLTNMDNGRIVPFDDHFLFSGIQKGIYAFDWDGRRIKTFDNSYFGISPLDSFGIVSFDQVLTLGRRCEIQITPRRLNIPAHQYDTINREFIIPPPENSILRKELQQHLRYVKNHKGKEQLAILYRLEKGQLLEILYSNGSRQEVFFEDSEVVDHVHLLQDQNGVFYATEDKMAIKTWNEFNIHTFLNAKGIRSIHQLEKDNFLVATEKGGFYQLNTSTLELHPYENFYKGRTIKPHLIRNVFVEGDLVWTNFDQGIAVFDLETGSIDQYRHYPVECILNGPDHLYYGTFQHAIMAFDKENRTNTILARTPKLWHLDILYNQDTSGLLIATNKGLLSYDFNTQETSLLNVQKYCASNYIMCMSRNSPSTILLGTNDGVILELNERNQTIELLFKDELKAPVATISVINDSTYWFNTFKGIVQWNRSNRRVIHRLSTLDGLSHNECNRYSQVKVDSQRWLIGTIKGLNLIETGIKEEQSKSVSFLLKGLSKFDAKRDSIATYHSDVDLAQFDSTIEIPAINRYLSLEFGFNNLLFQRSFKIQYRLDQTSWNPIGQDGFIRFSDFSSGIHKIDVRIVNTIGLSVGKTKSYTVIVEPYFYQKWWFYLLVITIVAAFLFHVYLQMKKEKQLQAKFSKELLEVREKELKNISREIHDSAGQNLIVLKQRAQQRNEDDLAELAGNALEELREISHNIHPFILEKFGITIAIKRLLRIVDERSNIFLTVEVEEFDGLFEKVEELHIYRLVQEAIANILKHSEAHSAVVKIIRSNNEINIRIKDNGKGFELKDGSESGNALGLRTIRERVRILHGRLALQTNLGDGTLIDVSLPIQKA